MKNHSFNQSSTSFLATFLEFILFSNVYHNKLTKTLFTWLSPMFTYFHLFFTYLIFHLLLIKIGKQHFVTWLAPIFHLCFTYFLFHLFFMKHWPTHSFTYFHLFSPIFHLFFTCFFTHFIFHTFLIKHWPKNVFTYLSSVFSPILG